MAAITSNDKLAEAEQLCSDLYRIRDTFFPPVVGEKEKRLDATVKAIFECIEASENSEGLKGDRKIKAAYLKGKAKGVFQDYNESAEKDLSKAVKLDPKNVDAWNCLGECFWKKQDYITAKSCFEGALKQGRESSTLRLLSILLRQIRPAATTVKEQIEKAKQNINESIKIAKEAVALDFKDAESWYVLGNAYLGSFFNLNHDPDDLKKALQAYERAVKFRDADKLLLPDLFYNRAEVHTYTQNYTQAVADYRTAFQIDPIGLKSQERIEAIRKKVLKASTLVKKKGGIKPKRLKAMCKAMMTNQHHLKLVDKVMKNTDEKLKAEVVGLADLKEGENPGTIVPLTFVVPIAGQGKIPPVLLIMADKDENCVCLAMYKVGYDRLDFFNSKHVYHVMHPVYKTVELDFGGETGKVTFPCIQLDHPRSLARDGTRLSDFYSHEFTTNQTKG